MTGRRVGVGGDVTCPGGGARGVLRDSRQLTPRVERFTVPPVGGLVRTLLPS